ncbi:hypothetical protein HPB47_000579, partial [Ixodes persulcatus]
PVPGIHPSTVEANKGYGHNEHYRRSKLEHLHHGRRRLSMATFTKITSASPGSTNGGLSKAYGTYIFGSEATARTWFKTHEASISSWEEFQADLRRTFVNQQRQQRAKELLQASTQGSNESVTSFVEDVLRLMNRADPNATKEKKRRVLMRGVRKNIFGGLLRSPPTTVKDFITEVKNIERAVQARASHYQRLPGFAALLPSSCNIPDSREITQDVVREEINKLLPAAHQRASLSIAEVFPEEVQRAIQPEAPASVEAPEEPSLTYPADLNTLVERLMDHHALTDELQLKLEAFGEIPLELLKGFEKNATRKLSGRRYSERTKQLAATLHYYSPQAYDYWRHTTSSVRDKLCVIMLDGMSVKRDVSLNVLSGKLVGYVTLGQGLGPQESDEVPMATEALVFIAVGVASPWKIPIGYFLTNQASRQLLKSLLEGAIAAVEDCGLHVKAVVCDGLGANVAMAKLLGYRVHETNYESLQPTFEHPTRPTEEVHFTFDACQALKLLRNLVGDKKVFKPLKGNRLYSQRRTVGTVYRRRENNTYIKLIGDSLNIVGQGMEIRHDNSFGSWCNTLGVPLNTVRHIVVAGDVLSKQVAELTLSVFSNLRSLRNFYMMTESNGVVRAPLEGVVSYADIRQLETTDQLESGTLNLFGVEGGHVGVVYRIPLTCGRVYIGQTGRVSGSSTPPAAEHGPRDDVTLFVGRHGSFQLTTFHFGLIAAFLLPFHTTVLNRVTPDIDHWCARPDNMRNLSVEQWKRQKIPKMEDGNYSRCTMFSGLNKSTSSVVPCDSWEFDIDARGSYVVQDFSLICDRSWGLPMSTSIFMVGAMCSLSISGPLAD